MKRLTLSYLEPVKDVLPSFTQLFCWVRDSSRVLYFLGMLGDFHTPPHKKQERLEQLSER